jgi:hypothetical protein
VLTVVVPTKYVLELMEVVTSRDTRTPVAARRKLLCCASLCASFGCGRAIGECLLVGQGRP